MLSLLQVSLFDVTTAEINVNVAGENLEALQNDGTAVVSTDVPPQQAPHKLIIQKLIQKSTTI